MRFALWTIVLEGVCLLAFVTVAATAWASPGKLLSVAAAFLAAAVMAWMASTRLSAQGAIQYAGTVAIGNVAVFETLAYTRFPGLAKDMDFASGEHLFRAIVFLLLSLAAHAGLVMAMRLIRGRGALRPAT